ncbi:MAG TPA: aromatic-ring-hydroxylating dioxygenase subunit beta [Burkholderiales bacterium]|nr:aromatic-ring-hydroxylating dioxygenase subunit beta [Burkholderiales bacterium]
MSIAKEVEALLYREARLLDERRFDEWLELFTQDAVYWVPAGGEAPDPAQHVSLVYDDRQRLELRVRRALSAQAWAQDPPSHTGRAVSNVELENGADTEATVHSVVTVVESRAGRQTLYMARCRYHLRRDREWKVARKEVRLVNRDDAFDNLTLLL